MARRPALQAHGKAPGRVLLTRLVFLPILSPQLWVALWNENHALLPEMSNYQIVSSEHLGRMNL